MSLSTVILASSSPRRRALLDQIGVACNIQEVEVDERRAPDETPDDYVVRVALAKVRAGVTAAGGTQRYPVLAADTIVVIDGDALQKPAGREEALEMLARLSGRRHWVMTAVAVAGESESVRLSISSVAFRAITPEEALAYWETGEPVGKAGAYAIQGLGAVFVSRIEGSYSGIVGLPLYETAELLSAEGVVLWQPRQ